MTLWGWFFNRNSRQEIDIINRLTMMQSQLSAILKRVVTMDSKIDDLQADADAIKADADTLSTKIDTVIGMLGSINTSSRLSPEDQSKLNSVHAEMQGLKSVFDGLVAKLPDAAQPAPAAPPASTDPNAPSADPNAPPATGGSQGDTGAGGSGDSGSTDKAGGSRKKS